MDLGELRSICQSVVRNYTENTLNEFVQVLSSIPETMANFGASYYSKLLSISATGLFSTIGFIFKNKVNRNAQLKILKFWDMLIETCNNESELRILFTENALNNLIMYPFEFCGEILQSYITVLKELSMKIFLIDIKFLLTDDMNDCPILSHSVPFIVHKDSIVLSGARLILLNLCGLNNERLNQIIINDFTNYPLKTLLNEMKQDDFIFLDDLIKISPVEISKIIIQRVRESLKGKDIIKISKSVLFLTNENTKDMIIDLVKQRLNEFPNTDVLTLSLLLYCIENKMIDIKDLNYFSTENFKNDILEIFKKQETYELFSISLELIGILFKELPTVIYDVKKELINSIEKTSVKELMHLILENMFYEKITIETVINNLENNKVYSPIKTQFLKFKEILEFSKIRLSDFDFNSNKKVIYKSYRTLDNNFIKLSSFELIYCNNTYKLSQVCLSENNSLESNVVCITYYNINSKLKYFRKKETEFHFPTQQIAMSFHIDLINYQDLMIKKILHKIKKIV